MIRKGHARTCEESDGKVESGIVVIGGKARTADHMYLQHTTCIQSKKSPEPFKVYGCKAAGEHEKEMHDDRYEEMKRKRGGRREGDTLPEDRRSLSIRAFCTRGA